MLAQPVYVYIRLSQLQSVRRDLAQKSLNSTEAVFLVASS